MMMNEAGMVVCAQSSVLKPPVSIVVAVDTAYVASQQGLNITEGVYMLDNQFSNGSTGEGGMELSSIVPLDSLVGFESIPIDPSIASTVTISGFTVSSGSIFGSAGYPMVQPPIGSEPAGSYWVGQAVNSGPTQTYQIQLMVTIGALRPTTYYINWDPFIATN